ncbi:MAG: hypothetical protein C7B43_15055 [Sulfobacillus benefaciens]|uniref:Uncharacterized protein n=1 Tax=Sulfobacillus benefaciens TaxID=453960 RepID=A0A2T2WV05_9FIRM|nr:MAG: hypothetical protein C7B43_15055 [Sulfobacillus benefaciens]
MIRLVHGPRMSWRPTDVIVAEPDTDLVRFFDVDPVACWARLVSDGKRSPAPSLDFGGLGRPRHAHLPGCAVSPLSVPPANRNGYRGIGPPGGLLSGRPILSGRGAELA